MPECEICSYESETIKGLMTHVAKKHKMSSPDYNEFILMNRPFCGCGCGNLVNWNNSSHRWCQYLNGHNSKAEGRNGIKNPNWKGGRHLSNGYWRIQMPEHPRADDKGYYLEHVILAEQDAGRYIKDNECVHHIDGNSRNNALDNLQIMTDGEHSAHHIKETQIWRKCLIAKDDLVSEMHKLYEELERLPRKADMRKVGRYSENPYIRVWGSWSNALKEILDES